MDAFNVTATPDKAKRDQIYREMRASGEPHVVKFSITETLMVPDVPGEIQLDNKGRICYRSLYCVAYPDSPMPVRIRGRIKKDRRGKGQGNAKNRS